MGDLRNPLPWRAGVWERQGHGAGQARVTLTGFISIQPIKEALGAGGQTRLKVLDKGRFKSFNPMVIMNEISARTSRQTRRPESHGCTSGYEHSGLPTANYFHNQIIRGWDRRAWAGKP